MQVGSAPSAPAPKPQPKPEPKPEAARPQPSPPKTGADAPKPQAEAPKPQSATATKPQESKTPPSPAQQTGSTPRTRDSVFRSQESLDHHDGGLTNERESHIQGLFANFGPAGDHESHVKPAEQSRPGEEPVERPQGIVGDEPKTKTYEEGGVPVTETSSTNQEGQPVRDKTYTKDGVQVQEITTNPDGFPRQVVLVRKTKNGEERTVTDITNENKPLEDLVDDPKARAEIQRSINHHGARGDRGSTEVSHSVTTFTSNGQPPDTVTTEDTKSYKQRIETRGEEFQAALGGLDGAQRMGEVSGGHQTITYTTGSKLQPGTQDTRQQVATLTSERKLEGKNRAGEKAEITETQTKGFLNGNATGGTQTTEYKGLINKGEVNRPLAGVENVTPVPDEYRDRLRDGNVDVRTTTILGPGGERISGKTEFGDYARQGEDGVTVAAGWERDKPDTYSLTNVSEHGHHVQSQTVLKGTKIKTIADTRTHGEPPETTTVSDTYNDGHRISSTSTGVRKMPVSQLLAGGLPDSPLDGMAVDPKQREAFLATLRRDNLDPDALVSQTYSQTTNYDMNGNLIEYDGEPHWSKNLSYTAPNGAVLSSTTQPIVYYEQPYGRGLGTEINPFETGISREASSTSLIDPNGPIPTSVAVDDGAHPRQYYTEGADGAVNSYGTLPDGTQAPNGKNLKLAKGFIGVLRPGANLVSALSDMKTDLGIVSAGLNYANLGKDLLNGSVPTLSLASATSSTGTLLKLGADPAEGLEWGRLEYAKGLGYLGGAVTAGYGISELMDHDWLNGSKDTMLGVGGILTTIGGAWTGPVGWAMVGVGGVIALGQAIADEQHTEPLEIPRV